MKKVQYTVFGLLMWLFYCDPRGQAKPDQAAVYTVPVQCTYKIKYLLGGIQSGERMWGGGDVETGQSWRSNHAVVFRNSSEGEQLFALVFLYRLHFCVLVTVCTQ